MRLTIVEFKTGLTVMPAMFRCLEYCEQIPGLKNLNKLLVYGGNSVRNREAGKVIPWNKFGEE